MSETFILIGVVLWMVLVLWALSRIIAELTETNHHLSGQNSRLDALSEAVQHEPDPPPNI